MSAEFPTTSTEQQPKSFLTTAKELILNLNTEGLKVDGDFEELKVQATENVNQARAKGTLYEASTLSTAYATHVFECIEQLAPGYVEKLKERFKDKVIIDLGAGRDYYGYAIATMLGAKGYVGVEPFNSAGLVDSIGSEVKYFRSGRSKKDENIKYTVVAEDALTFLKRIPEGTEGITIFSSGTDNNVFPDSNYNSEVAKQIARALNVGGTVVLHASTFGQYFPKSGFEIEETPSSNSYAPGLNILTKLK
jgi:hypothetical protein